MRTAASATTLAHYCASLSNGAEGIARAYSPAAKKRSVLAVKDIMAAVLVRYGVENGPALRVIRPALRR